jgi:aspartate carbamoyltransferase catalytic subunit
MKHLLSAADLSREEALQILDTAKQLSVATEQGLSLIHI